MLARKRWIPPESFSCPDRARYDTKDTRCIGEVCTLWDGANGHCTRYNVGWVFEEELTFTIRRDD